MFRIPRGVETVTVKTPTISYDASKNESVSWSEQTVSGVLFGRPSTEDLNETARYNGVEIAYTVAFPKEFTGNLRGCKVVRSDGESFDVLGDPRAVDASLCPTPWNRAVDVAVAHG